MSYRRYIYIYIYIPPSFWHRLQNTCNFLSDKSTGSIFHSKICFLTMFPDSALLNPWSVLGDRNIFCSNEAALSRPLDRGWLPERPRL